MDYGIIKYDEEMEWLQNGDKRINSICN
jgi:hypothetical protein